MPDKPRTISHGAANLPVTGLRDWLPERMLACVIVGIVERLDLSGLEPDSGTDSQQAIDPAKLLALLFFGYTSGVFSSRDLEKATYQSDVYRFITANTHPHHLVITAFRKCFTADIERLFVRVLGISYMMKQANLGGPRLDRKQLEKKLHREVSALLKCAETADAEARSVDAHGQKFAQSTATETRAGRTDSSTVRPAKPVHTERESVRLQPETRSARPGSTAASAQLDPTSSGKNRTYTFLSRKGAVTAMAPDGSKSIVGPLFADKRTAKPDIKKHRGDLPRTPRRRPGNGRAGGIAALLAAGLAAVFLLVRYVDWHDASSPAHVPLSAGNIQRESDAEPLIQAELAALMDTVLDRTDSPPGLTQSTQDRPTSESVHIIPGVPDTSEQSESDTEIARMDSASEPEPVLQPLAPEADTIHREDWLLDQPRGNYMLQLRWDRDQVTLKRFTEQYRLPGPSAYYKEQWNDKDRYVLVYGNYPTRHAALADLETLPEPVRNNGPWPRKMTSIQTLIRQQEDAPLR